MPASAPSGEFFEAPFFAHQSERPAQLAPIRATELSPLQRGLLVIDGTVTTFLEAWALEPIAVTPLWQRRRVLEAPDRWLDAAADTVVVDRAVILTGVRSGAFFAFAESMLCIDRLPPPMRTALESGSGSLGQALLTPGHDSRREGLWFGRERLEALPPAVAARTDATFLSRTYRVTAGGVTLMLITERFPWRPMAVPTGTGPPGRS